MRVRFLALILLFLSGVVGRAPAQDVFQKNGDAWPVVLLSPDRAEDTYAIYSLLVPGELPNTLLQHHPQWLISDTTLIVGDGMDNPHTSITPPLSQRPAFAAVLQDFEQHKHERVRLEKNFHLDQPYQLLNPSQRAEFQTSFQQSLATQTDSIPAKYRGAMGLLYFSNVYFNFEHTLAMVYVAYWCGPKCSQMRWVALQKVNGGWSLLPWPAEVQHP